MTDVTTRLPHEERHLERAVRHLAGFVKRNGRVDRVTQQIVLTELASLSPQRRAAWHALLQKLGVFPSIDNATSHEEDSGGPSVP